MIRILHDFGGACLFFSRTLKTLFATHGNLSPILAQVSSITYRTLPTVIFSGIFVGAILVLQFNLILAKYGAQSLLGGLHTSAIIREVGPLIISFLLAAKIGAYTAAELATMRVTEQIDAIECLGTDAIQYLIIPRLIGIIISSLILMTIGLMISVFGAMAIASALCGINVLEFVSTISRFASFGSFLAGLFKSLIYGTLVATVACHKGFCATGGARGVGRAVTHAAVYTNFYILIANYFTSRIIELVSLFAHKFHGGFL